MKELYILMGVIFLLTSIIFINSYPYLGLVFIIMGSLLLVLKVKTDKYIIKLLVIIVILFFTSLVLGIGRYRIITVTSESMEPNIYRGDAVIIKKVSSIKEIEKEKIIAYQKDNNFVMHRVINVEKINNSYIYTTKGDNNNMVDDYKLSLDNVYGIYVYRIPYIGYPSIWFREKVIKNITRKQ